jgi:hypothetical protein
VTQRRADERGEVGIVADLLPRRVDGGIGEGRLVAEVDERRVGVVVDGSARRRRRRGRRFRASLRAMASARSGASMPERIFCASVGPIPEIAISFSNANFSSSDAKPYSESASSRTCV